MQGNIPSGHRLLGQGPWLDDGSGLRFFRWMIGGGLSTCVVGVFLGNITKPPAGFPVFLTALGLLAVVFGALGWGLAALVRCGTQRCPACRCGMPRGATRCPHCHFHEGEEPV